MTTCTLVIATLLTAAPADPDRGAQPPRGDKPRHEFLIEWKELPRGEAPGPKIVVEEIQGRRWTLEIRGYTFHRGPLPPAKGIQEINIDKVITSPLKPPGKAK